MLLLTIIMTAFAVNALAYTPPDKPANGWYVVDQAGKLTDAQKTQLNTKIDNINKTTKNEFGVLIIQSLDGDNIEDAAQATFRAWGIGKVGLNNGILIMISAGDRKMRLQTGKGVESELPDLRAKDLLDQQLKPLLKKNDYYGGIDNLINTTSTFLESHVDQSIEKSIKKSNEKSISSAIIEVSIFVIGFALFYNIIIFFVGRYKKRKEEDLIREQERITAIFKLNNDTYTAIAAAAIKEKSEHNSSTSNTTAAVVGGTAAIITAAAIIEREKAAKRRQEQEEEDRRRREESSYSSYSSSYSNDSSSWGGSDSGGGFGGGDSGGSGSSSNF